MKVLTLERKAAGLYTHFNPLSATPEGALLEAQNVVIDREGVISKRRGFNLWGSPTEIVTSLMEFSDALYCVGKTSKTLQVASATFPQVGYAGPPDSSTRVRGLQIRSSLFYTTDRGLYKLADTSGGSAVRAGMPKGLDLELSLTGTGWFAADGQVGYRVIFGREDVNGFLVLGAPSEPETLTNPAAGSSQNVQVKFTLPGDLVAGDFYEIYRTQQSASDTTRPGDRMLKVARVAITSGDLTTGTITYTDSVIESSLGEELYTNATQETISQANDVPPWSKDIALFKGHTFYLNVKREEYFQLQLLDASSLSNGDTITTGGVTYTAGATEVIGSNQFQLYTSGTAAENTRDTMKSFVRVLNRTSSNTTLYAYYISGENDPPGKVLVRARDYTVSSFTTQATTGTAYEPDLSSAGTSKNDATTNRLWMSKYEQPEAVPRGDNFWPIGSELDQGMRLLALRDSLLILMDAGIWRLSGQSESDFTISQLDPTTKIVAPETAQVLNNAAWCLSDQGVVRIDESGTQIISRPIENEILKVLATANVSTIAHAVAFETERKYFLFAPANMASTTADKAWVYNYITRAWTTMDFLTGGIESGHVLRDTRNFFLSESDNNVVVWERRGFLDSSDDYYDRSIGITNVSYSTVVNADGDTVTRILFTWTPAETTAPSSPPVGGYFVDGIWKSRVVSVTQGSTSSEWYGELEELLSGASSSTASYYLPIKSRVRWKPEDAGNPSVRKQFVACQLYPEADTSSKITLKFFSDVDSTEDSVDSIAIARDLGWGLTGWGSLPWGDSGVWKATPLRVMVPRNFSHARTLSLVMEHQRAKEKFDVLSISYLLRPVSDLTVRTP